MPTALTALIDALAELYAAEGRPGGDEVAAALRRHRNDTPSKVEVQHLDDAPFRAVCAGPGGLDAARAVLAVWDQLGWRYPGLDKGMIPEPIAKRMISCEFLGPEGTLRCDTCRVGFFGQLPGLDYPGRTHAAEETFITLAGEGDWTCEPDTSWHTRGPGGICHHPSMARHRSRTRESAFLTAWRWTGDIGFESYQLLD